jgi:flagellar FliJ protein
MKFKFRLQKLLEYREQIKKEAEQDYQSALSDVNLAEHELERLFETVHNSYQYIGNSINQKVSAGRSSIGLVNYTEDYIRGQKYQIELQKQRINELKSIAEKKREVMVELATDFHVLEKLKDKSYEEYKVQLKKLEAKEIDDLVTMGFRKKSG